MAIDLFLLATEIRNRTGPDFALLAKWREWLPLWTKNAELERERGELERELASLRDNTIDADEIADGFGAIILKMFREAKPTPADLAARLSMLGSLDPSRLAGDRPTLLLSLFAGVAASGTKPIEALARRMADAVRDAIKSTGKVGVLNARAAMSRADRDARIANARARLESVTAEIEAAHKSRPERWGKQIGTYTADRWTLAVSDWMRWLSDYARPVEPPSSEHEYAVELSDHAGLKLVRAAGLDKALAAKNRRTIYRKNWRGEYVDADLCADKPGEVCNVAANV